MTEQVGAELVKAKTRYADLEARPFVRQHSNEVHVSLGLTEGLVPVVKYGLLGKHQEVMPVIEGYGRVSSKHGRDIVEIGLSKTVIWGGKFPADIYGARTIKGTAMGSGHGIDIKHYDLSHYKLHGFGLMDDSVLPRIIKASEVMRKNGLPTEFPRTVKNLNEVWVRRRGGWEKISMASWKSELIKRAEEANRYNKRYQLRSSDATHDPEKVRRYLQETKFIALERDVQVDERLEDLRGAAFRGKLRDELLPVLKWLNAVFATRQCGILPGTPKPEPFTFDEKGIERYFKDFLPTNMGIYLARMHKLGLAHHYPHFGNWTAAATLIDLDSVTGKILYSDDQETTNKDIAKDLGDVIAGIELLTGVVYEFDSTTNYEIPKKFLKTYLSEKYGGKRNLNLVASNEEKSVILKHGLSAVFA